jgi:hypothetical protein
VLATNGQDPAIRQQRIARATYQWIVTGSGDDPRPDEESQRSGTGQTVRQASPTSLCTAGRSSVRGRVIDARSRTNTEPLGELKPDLMGGRVARYKRDAHGVTGLGVRGGYLCPHRWVGELNGCDAALD